MAEDRPARSGTLNITPTWLSLLPLSARRRESDIRSVPVSFALSFSSRSCPEASDIASLPLKVPTPVASCCPVSKAPIPNRKLPASEKSSSARASFRLPVRSRIGSFGSPCTSRMSSSRRRPRSSRAIWPIRIGPRFSSSTDARPVSTITSSISKPFSLLETRPFMERGAKSKRDLPFASAGGTRVARKLSWTPLSAHRSSTSPSTSYTSPSALSTRSFADPIASLASAPSSANSSVPVPSTARASFSTS